MIRGAHMSVGDQLRYSSATQLRFCHCVGVYKAVRNLTMCCIHTVAEEEEEEKKEGSMLRRAASESAVMVSGYRQGEAVGAYCTESLGSESGDVGGEEAEIDQLGPAAGSDHEEEAAGWEGSQASPEKRRRTERRLPPAMPRAAEAFMRAERRGGRLILTEVVRTAERPREVFRASRADGRLLLRFAAADDDDASPAPGSEPETRSNAETSGVVVPAAGCCNCNGAVGFRHATAGGSGATSRVEVGAVMGI